MSTCSVGSWDQSWKSLPTRRCSRTSGSPWKIPPWRRCGSPTARLGVIEASTAVYPGYLKRIEISGSQGTAIMEEEDIKAWQFAKMTSRDKKILADLAGETQTGGGASDPAAIGHHGHTAQFKDVLAAIKKGTSPAIDGPEGRKAVEVILGIYKAAETGKAVTLPLKSDPVLKARKK